MALTASRLALLDALRGVAALTVAWHHLTVHFPFLIARRHEAWLPAAGSWIADRNGEAVLLFFVLSGLSIRLSVRALDLRLPGQVTEYLRRRLRRIVPLYLSSLVLAGLVGWSVAPARPSSLSLTTLAGNLLFLQTSAATRGTWFEPYAENGPLWSLSFEMFYYLAFPAVAMLADARARLLLVCAVSFVGLAVLQVLPNPIAAFCASFLVWYLGVELAQALLNGRASVPWWSFSLLSCIVAGVLGWRASATLSGILTGLIVFHVGYAAVLGAQRGWAFPAWVARLLIGPLAWLGSFSYGLYLLHFPVLRAAAALWPAALGAALGALASLLLAYAAEAWARRFVRRAPR